VHALAYAHGYGDYLALRWLWGYLHWWSLPVYGAFLGVTGFVRAMIKGRW
jgi:hypothetical protein